MADHARQPQPRLTGVTGPRHAAQQCRIHSADLSVSKSAWVCLPLARRVPVQFLNRHLAEIPALRRPAAQHPARHRPIPGPFVKKYAQDINFAYKIHTYQPLDPSAQLVQTRAGATA